MAWSLALLPIFLLIGTGYLLRRLRFPGADFWAPAEKLIYYVLFPALLVLRLTEADFSNHVLRLGPALVLALLLASGLLSLLQKGLAFPPAVFTSVYQGGLRFNSYIGLAGIHAVLGAEALALAAVSIGIMIPLINVLCVLCFARWIPGHAPGLPGTLSTMLKNPLILACGAGILLNLLGFRFPAALEQVLHYLGSMALPLGLLCVGAALRIGVLSRGGHPLLVSTAFKLLLMPVLFTAAGYLSGLQGTPLLVMALLGALPTATSSYILARQLGGDAELMAVIISAQTLLAMLSLPVVLSGLAWLVPVA